MATQSEKEQVIRTIYYDDDGFDNIKTTYEKSKNVLPSITLDDVKQFLSKQKIRQKKIIAVLTVMSQTNLYTNCKLIWPILLDQQKKIMG